MQKILQSIFSTCFVLLSSFPCAHAGTLPKENNIKQALQKVVDEDRIKYHLPALSVSVSLENDSGIMDITTGTTTLHGASPITSASLFQIGSITKTYISALIYTLEAQKLLSVNDTVGKWLPQYPQWRNVTIQQLLTHSSGIYEVFDTPNFWVNITKNPNKQWTLNELANLAYQFPNYFPPGKKVKYTNTNYIVAGMIIEKATHKSVYDNLNHYFFIPQHLIHSHYLPLTYSQLLLSQMAHGYNDEGTFPLNTDVTTVNTSYDASAGAIVANPHEILQFTNRLFSEKNILSQRQLDEMMNLISENTAQPITLIDIKNSVDNQTADFADIGFGSGVGLVYFKKYGFKWMHAGGTLGYESVYAWDPCKNIIVSLVYNRRPKQQFIFIKILEDIFEVLNQKTLYKVSDISNDQKYPAYCKFQMH